MSGVFAMGARLVSPWGLVALVGLACQPAGPKPDDAAPVDTEAETDTRPYHLCDLGAETHEGPHGRPRPPDGPEPTINDRALDRAIAEHGGAHDRPEHVAEWGYLGRSFGCPAIDDREAQQLIDALAEGSLLFIGHPAVDWRGGSELWWGE